MNTTIILRIALFLVACLLVNPSVMASEDVEPTWQVQIAKARELMDPSSNHHYNNHYKSNNAQSRRSTRNKNVRQLKHKGKDKAPMTTMPTAPPTPNDPDTLAPFFELELGLLDEMTAPPTMSKGDKGNKGKGGSRKGSTGKGSSKGNLVTNDDNTLTSFFQVEFQTTTGNPTFTELETVANAMVGWYNDLTASEFVDPLERQMTKIEIVPGRRRLRQLQNLNIFVFLRVSGTCRGCRQNPFFTNQVVGRRQLFDKIVSEDWKDGVPTEAEFLQWCSERILGNAQQFGSIVDMVSLQEIESLPSSKTSKKSHKGKGTSARLSTTTPNTASDSNRISINSVSASYPVVQVQAVQEDKCMSYHGGDSTLQVETCSSAVEQHWEVIGLSDTSSSTFQLRHQLSKLCLPQNAEFPSSQFDCFVSNPNAQAHAIVGLVDCDSPHVATVGFMDGHDYTLLYQQDCASGSSPGADTDIILMSYVMAQDNVEVVVWGEKIMLDLQGIVSESRGMQGSWKLKHL